MKILKKRSGKAGMPAGSLVHIGDKKVAKTTITLIDYDERKLQEKEVKSVEECFPFKDAPTVTWINLDGISDIDVIKKLGDTFGIHPLLVEDILNTDQRPKIEDFNDYMYIVLRTFYFKGNGAEIDSEQISILVGSNFVISLQEQKGEIFNHVRERIKNEKSTIRKSGPDYLAYRLLDAVVDNYFIILEKLGDDVEYLEDELVTNPSSKTIHRIHELKRDMIVIRKSVWPLREVISTLTRSESQLIKDPTKVFIRDVYDHTIQVIDAVESFRDILAGMIDIYLSSISNRMNEIMKVLTVIATIFMPLTFMAGVYGMNFRYMPELQWKLGYPFALSLMLVVALTMAVYFRKKKWI